MKWRFSPVEYGALERLLMRLLFAIVVAAHIPASLAHLSISRPNGLARLIDLGFLLDPQVLAGFRYALWLMLVFYVLRIGWALVLPYMTLLSIAVGSINNSHGAISHTFQILSLVLLAQTAAYYYAKVRKLNRDAAENRMIFWSQQAIAATYLVSAITKLINSSGMWFVQTPYVAVQIVKTTEQNYYNTLDATSRAAGLAIADWIVHHPLLVGMVMTAGFFIELLAPLALLSRRWALSLGLGLVLFHETIDRVMKLHFAYNEYLLWIYLVNVPFWTLAAVRWWSARSEPAQRVQ